MLDVVGPERLVVVANTGDDIEIYGAYVSPDPDLVTFWLADRIDERGWGLKGDTFAVMDGLRELGVDVWFNLGDRDLAIGLERARALQGGSTPTAAHAAIMAALGVPGTVLPASDVPIRTRVMAHDRWWGFQEFMIRGQARGPVQDVNFHGARTGRATRQVLQAIADADAIVIGPSNPIASIGPILATQGLQRALRDARAAVVAVSPLVRGEVIKGPTAAFMEWAEQPLSSEGIVRSYAGLISGLVADERTDRLPVLEAEMLLDTPERRRELAGQTLDFALALSR
jgi:LPPG:FO 2-phospho-L-lactate transferase